MTNPLAFALALREVMTPGYIRDALPWEALSPEGQAVWLGRLPEVQAAYDRHCLSLEPPYTMAESVGDDR